MHRAWEVLSEWFKSTELCSLAPGWHIYMQVDGRTQVFMCISSSPLQVVCLPHYSLISLPRACICACGKTRRNSGQKIQWASWLWGESCRLFAERERLETNVQDLRVENLWTWSKKGWEIPRRLKKEEEVLGISKEGRILGSAPPELPRESCYRMSRAADHATSSSVSKSKSRSILCKVRGRGWTKKISSLEFQMLPFVTKGLRSLELERGSGDTDLNDPISYTRRLRLRFKKPTQCHGQGLAKLRLWLWPLTWDLC